MPECARHFREMPHIDMPARSGTPHGGVGASVSVVIWSRLGGVYDVAGAGVWCRRRRVLWSGVRPVVGVALGCYGRTYVPLCGGRWGGGRGLFVQRVVMP